MLKFLDFNDCLMIQLYINADKIKNKHVFNNKFFLITGVDDKSIEL